MKVLMQFNLCFYPISLKRVFISNTSAKYFAGDTHSIYPEEIYTLEEIKKAYPDIKEVELTGD